MYIVDVYGSWLFCTDMKNQNATTLVAYLSQLGQVLEYTL